MPWKTILTFTHDIQVDRIIFGDPAVVMYVKQHEHPIPLNWDAETLNNELFSVNVYWGKKVQIEQF